MPKFYFHLEMSNGVYSDEEGRDLPDVEHVRANAVLDARDLMAADVKAGRLCLGDRICIVDEQGVVVLSLPFHEAVEFSGLDELREHEVIGIGVAHK